MAYRYPETTRAARILEMVSRIGSQPRLWTRAGLANSFEISERQVTKDLDIIRHGLRLSLKHEHSGGYYFEAIPRLPAIAYSLSEALAIYLAAEAGRRMVGIPQEDLSAALGRLSSIMPSELKPLLTNGTMMPVPRVRDRHREVMLTTIYHAIADRTSVEMEYLPASRPTQTTERRVDPYAVLPTGHSWHVVGWCHLRSDVRIFKVDRIKRLERTEVRFEPDSEFDVEEFLMSGWGISRMPESAPEEIELHFRGPAAQWVSEETWHPTQDVQWLDDGSVRFRLTLPVTEEFSRWVLGYGAYCEVIQPESLRDWIHDQAKALIAARER